MYPFQVVTCILCVLAVQPAAWAEKSGASTAAISKILIGSWRSEANVRFTRTFAADGSVTDRMEANEADTTKAQWRLFTDKDRDGALEKVMPGVTYLRVDNGTDVIFFEIVKADRRRLYLRYADRRGLLLRFTRVINIAEGVAKGK